MEEEANLESKTEKELRQKLYEDILGPAIRWGGLYDSDKEVMGAFCWGASIKIIKICLEDSAKYNRNKMYEIAEKFYPHNEEVLEEYFPNISPKDE